MSAKDLQKGTTAAYLTIPCTLRPQRLSEGGEPISNQKESRLNTTEMCVELPLNIFADTDNITLPTLGPTTSRIRPSYETMRLGFSVPRLLSAYDHPSLAYIPRLTHSFSQAAASSQTAVDFACACAWASASQGHLAVRMTGFAILHDSDPYMAQYRPPRPPTPGAAPAAPLADMSDLGALSSLHLSSNASAITSSTQPRPESAYTGSSYSGMPTDPYYDSESDSGSDTYSGYSSGTEGWNPDVFIPSVPFVPHTPPFGRSTRTRRIQTQVMVPRTPSRSAMESGTDVGSWRNQVARTALVPAGYGHRGSGERREKKKKKRKHKHRKHREIHNHYYLYVFLDFVA